jgi:hypothetical protein
VPGTGAAADLPHQRPGVEKGRLGHGVQARPQGRKGLAEAKRQRETKRPDRRHRVRRRRTKSRLSCRGRPQLLEIAPKALRFTIRSTSLRVMRFTDKPLVLPIAVRNSGPFEPRQFRLRKGTRPGKTPSCDALVPRGTSRPFREAESTTAYPAGSSPRRSSLPRQRLAQRKSSSFLDKFSDNFLDKTVSENSSML